MRVHQCLSKPALALAAALSLAACQQPPAKPAPPTPEAMVERGKYLVTVMDCAGCHSSGALIGQTKPETYLAGSDEGFDLGPPGIFYPPNLTPDKTGLGDWTPAQIVQALRTGVRPDGRILAPIMPWRGFATLTDDDANSIAAYLKSLKPYAHKVAGPSTAETAPTPYLTLKIPQKKGAAG